MTFSLTWLPDVLKAAGCKVTEAPGWEYRGHGDFGPPKGILLHHTAGPAHGNIPSLFTLVHGRPDLAGPLCNLGLARDGTFYIVAAGKAWHAGYGWWEGVTDGNGQLIGIEMENAGTGDDPWPPEQVEAARLGVSALLKHIGAAPIMCAGHLEYARNAKGLLGRKIDPIDFDLDAFRASLTPAEAVA